MYIPKEYQSESPEFALQFMRQHPFAELISINETGRLIATHLPVLVDKKEDAWMISGHLSAANEQVKNVHDQEALLIFREPHAYISPSHYDAHNSVPTWNYAAIHCYVRSTILASSEEKYEQMKQFVTHFENNYLPSFLSLDDQYLERMLKGIVMYRFEVSNMEVKKKLSQNKSEIEKRRIIETLSKGNEQEQSIAQMMKD